jgi:hypothetical protein
VSMAGGCVRFPDGHLRYFLYHVTTAIVWPVLFDTIDEAWADTGSHEPDWAEDTEPVDVEIYLDYGGGFWWKGRATELAIESPLWDVDQYTTVHQGIQPEWVRWKSDAG